MQEKFDPRVESKSLCYKIISIVFFEKWAVHERDNLGRQKIKSMSIPI